jgi:hypothetical protein
MSGQVMNTFFATEVGRLRPRRSRNFLEVICEVTVLYVDFQTWCQYEMSGPRVQQ